MTGGARTALLAALAAGLSACGSAKPPAAPQPASAPRDEACATVQAVIAHHARASQAIREDAKARDGVAAALVAMRGSEAASVEAAESLDHARIADDDLARRARAYADAARVTAAFLGTAEKTLETASSEIGAQGRAMTDAMADLAGSCPPKKAPRECAAVGEKLAQLGATDAGRPDALEAAAGALDAVPVKTLGAKVARVTAAARALAGKTRAALKEFDEAKSKAIAASIEAAAKGIEQRCGAWPALPNVAPWATAEWIAPEKADVRKLTVVVKVLPPPPIVAAFAGFAKSDDELSGLYRAVAAGVFGSGLVLVKGEGASKRAYVVTNRHVVELADEADIFLDGGAHLGRAPVVYADPWYDLAVLALPEGAPFEHGFAFADSPAKDQSPVIATGFPGIGAQPSYQTTRGFVSNERFLYEDDGRTTLYVQHTAPIDGGSSGGPLTTLTGALLGVNTMKLRGRENVGLAAPAFAVAEVAHHASLLERLGANVEWRRQRARDACLAVIGELGAGKPRLRVAEQMLSSWALAREGLDSFKDVSSSEKDPILLWKRDPLEAMRAALVIRMVRDARAAGGVDGTESCDRPDEGDWVNLATGDSVRFRVRIGRADRTLALRWERGLYRLVSLDVPRMEPPKPPKAPKPPKPAVSAKGSSPRAPKSP